MPASTREKILTAALRHVDERGVAAARLEEIRTAAGASVGSVYHAFPGGKEELVGALYLHVLDGYQRAFLEELDRHATLHDGVRAIVDLHVRWCVKHPAEARFLVAGRDAAPSDELRALNRPFFEHVLRWWHRAGGRDDLPLELIDALWLGPAQQLVTHWLAGRACKPTPTTRRVLADAAWTALRSTA
jgi:AcrR family transcriptional regulator